MKASNLLAGLVVGATGGYALAKLQDRRKLFVEMQTPRMLPGEKDNRLGAMINNEIDPAMNTAAALTAGGLLALILFRDRL